MPKEQAGHLRPSLYASSDRIDRSAQLTDHEIQRMASSPSYANEQAYQQHAHHQGGSALASPPNLHDAPTTTEELLHWKPAIPPSRGCFPSGSRKPAIAPAGVNPCTPLARLVNPEGLVGPPSPSLNTDLIIDAVYAICLSRIPLIVASNGLDKYAILQFVMVYLPFHTTYTQLVLEHDRNFAKHDLLHVVYTCLRVALLFGLAFVAPMVFNIVDATWKPFASLVLIGRALSGFAHVVVGLEACRTRSGTRAWWLISVRATAILLPCLLWGILLGFDSGQADVRESVWVAAVGLDLACVLLLGLSEAWTVKKTMYDDYPAANRAIEGEDGKFEQRTGALLSLILALGVTGLFDTKPGVGSPDTYTAVSFYVRSFLCAACGVVCLYAIDRIYKGSQATLQVHHTTASHPPNRITVSPGLPTNTSALTTTSKTTTPNHIAQFLRASLRFPLYAFAILFVFALQVAMEGISYTVREIPAYDYTPPSNAPFLTAANVAQNNSPAAALYVQTYNTEMPYAAALFLPNPVRGGTSTLTDTRKWTNSELMSVCAALLIGVMALMGFLNSRCGGGYIGAWSVRGLALRVIFTMMLAVPGLIGATAVVTLLSLTVLLIVGCIFEELFTPAL
ncbi:uncharacterized protein EV422DRAFT_504404 [Fimicolochytrium jonesii]|uniref:uncharacterized protein n=1 Tax=Fimicolochytrium jonesii TaxID=1396493 RepID=UPI0022FE0796|nr:uncharacterized protein EV422DRAFT_504404 [Fimicolochytrium jonesii]KAI8824398.1 hypothetical protein EV422DRAFT_504404 [Fimicolochytrium jonesii]